MKNLFPLQAFSVRTSRLLQAAACALLALALAPASSLAQTREIQSGGDSLDRIAAVVNDGVVLQSELDEQVAQITERLRTQKLELPAQSVIRDQVLERLIVQEIEMQRADRAGLKINDETLNNAKIGRASCRERV